MRHGASIVALCLLATACGGGGGSDPAPSPPTPTPTPTPTPPAPVSALTAACSGAFCGAASNTRYSGEGVGVLLDELWRLIAAAVAREAGAAGETEHD